MPCLCRLVPWLHAWSPWRLYWCLCVGDWWWLHLGWLLLWWTPCCHSLTVQGCWIKTGGHHLAPRMLSSSEGHHLALAPHLTHLPVQEEQLQPPMSFSPPNTAPISVASPCQREPSSLPGTNIMLYRCLVFKNIPFIFYKNIC